MGFLSDDERAQLSAGRGSAAPLPDPHADRIERRIFPGTPDRETEAGRGPAGRNGRSAGEAPGRQPPPLLPDRLRHGRRLPGDEPGLRQAVRRHRGRGRDAGNGQRTRHGAAGPGRVRLPHALPARRHPADQFRRHARRRRQGRLEFGTRRQGTDHRRPEVRQLLQGSVSRQRHQGRAADQLAVRRAGGLVPDQRNGVPDPRPGEQAGRRPPPAGALHHRPRPARLAGRHRPCHRQPAAGWLEGLHDRRQHAQGHQPLSVAAGRRKADVSGLRTLSEGRHQERLHPQGPVPAVGRESWFPTCCPMPMSATSARRPRTGRD